jgi:GNAT superfamily N-acetyltransferase
MEWQQGDYIVSDDRSQLDHDVVFSYLHDEAYWSKGLSEEEFARSLEHSTCFGASHRGAQVGFCRVVTDRATFAWLADVFVLPQHRGKGVAQLLVTSALSHPDLQGLRQWLLATRDAHGLYLKLGFTPPAEGRYLERRQRTRR